MDSGQNSPFYELPASLVDEILERTDTVGQELHHSFEELKRSRDHFQRELREANMVRRLFDLPVVDAATVAAVDGSYAIERMLAVDIAAAAAVAVEGLTPPSETRYWPDPRHRLFIEVDQHHSETGSILRGIAIGMELLLAAEAPHDVVLLDGSMTTPTIYLNQSLAKVADVPGLKSSQGLVEIIIPILEAYRQVLLASRTDHSWVALPKYTTRREIGYQLKWPQTHDDRALLTNLLEAGEYTRPLPLSNPKSPWHITTAPIQTNSSQAEKLVEEIVEHLKRVQVVYFKPRSWLPALRLEMSPSIAENRARLAAVLTAIQHQCSSPAILEPYPLYLADRFVKHLSGAMPAFRQITSQRLAETYSGNIDDVFINLHGYRTESGR